MPSDYETKLEQISEDENLTPSEIIQKALENYFHKYYQKPIPYELGEDLFGKYGSGKGNLSRDYKKLLKEKFYEKHTH
jgi:hypothetical protein